MSLTPLMMAARDGDLEGVVGNLKMVGKQDEKGRTALMMAARKGHSNLIPLLEKEIGVHDNKGWTALIYAASRGHTEAVRLLRPLEARLQDGKGWTALMHALRRGHGDCVRLLLLEQDIKDEEDKTAEDIASSLPEEARRKTLPLLETRPQLPLLPGELSAYQITERLGKGAFGTIFSAFGNGQNVAVKVVNLGGHDEKGQEKLRGEAKILLSLNHPNIIRCLGVGENDLEKTYMFVTELCCGDLRGEMSRRMKARSSYSDREVWRMIRDVAAALAFIHEKRVVHRDIKPANVFLTPSGRCVLGDFGLAKAFGDSSQMETFAGTPAYMAPEIHRNEEYDKSVDIWALGVMAYEICTYALPFESRAAVIGETSAPRIEGRSSELAELISRMLSKDPRGRLTAREVLEEVEKHQPPLDG